ncbi:hypothetical protein ABR738_17365 [Streptomyces sp. Edi4]|uniref:hypothetical protein n=1 Tax=Streptomyces sp. Edi4 TaxID=3162527 RepID=UPI003305C27C
MSPWPPELDPLPEPEPVFTPEITEADCRKCGTRVAGLDGRYACGVCGWTNDWSEGHRPLPSGEDDPDYPGPDGPGNRLTR